MITKLGRLTLALIAAASLSGCMTGAVVAGAAGTSALTDNRTLATQFHDASISHQISHWAAHDSRFHKIAHREFVV